MPTVAREDLTLHRKIGEGEDPKGNVVELTEGLPLRAGDAVPVDEIASYQQEDLKDKESNLYKLTEEVSDEKFAEIQALKSAPASTSNEDTAAEGDAIVTKTSANKEGS